MVVDWNEVDGTCDAGLQTLGRDTLDLADARLAGGELPPVVFTAGAERGDDAHAGGDDNRPPCLVSLDHRSSPHLLDGVDESDSLAAPMSDARDNHLPQRSIYRTFNPGCIERR